MLGAPGEVVAAAGRNRLGDGAGGLFVWVAGALPALPAGGFQVSDAGTSVASVGGLYVIPDGGAGHWRRVFSGPIDVTWLGAGLGATGPVSPGEIDTLAFEHALAASQAIYVPRGNYRVVRPLALGVGVQVVGDGHTSVIVYAPTEEQPERGLFDGVYNPASVAANGTIEHLRIEAGSDNARVAIRLWGAFRFTVANVYIDGMWQWFAKAGIAISGSGPSNSAAITISGCHVQNCAAAESRLPQLTGSAIVLEGAANAAISVVGGTRLQANTGWGILSVLDPWQGKPTPSQLFVADCVIEGNGGGIGGALGPCIIRGTHFEQQFFAPHIDASSLAKKAGRKLGVTTPTSVVGLVVEGCKFVSSSSGYDECHIRLVPDAFGGGGVTVRGNLMSGARAAFGVLGFTEGVAWGPNVEIPNLPHAPVSVMVYSTAADQASIHSLQLHTSRGLVPCLPTRFASPTKEGAFYTCEQHDQIVLVDGRAPFEVVLPDPTFEHTMGGRTLTVRRVLGTEPVTIRPRAALPHSGGPASIEGLAPGAPYVMTATSDYVTFVFSPASPPIARRWFVVARGQA